MTTEVQTSLAGQVALVTGAASGLGREIAETYAKAGAAVGIADLNLEGANKVAEEINAAGGKAFGKHGVLQSVAVDHDDLAVDDTVGR